MAAGKHPRSDTDPASLKTPNDLGDNARQEIADSVNKLVADAFALYVKTKNFHWHMTGPHFRDYHLMLDEQSDQIFATTDPLAERVRKLGKRTIHSIGEINGKARVKNNDADFIPPLDMLRELTADNKNMAAAMRETHEICDKHNDVATASLLEVYIDETERRTWFLFEAMQGADETGH